MLLWLYRAALGILTVEISGYMCEKFLNKCALNGISLWNIKKKNSKIICCITARDFKYLPALMKKSGLRVHIIKKSGVPFVRKRYSKRYGIAAGAAVFFGILLFMSRFIWVIDVKGNHSVSAGEIISLCREMGITEGAYIKKIDPKNAKQQLLLKDGRLAWAAFNIEGCRLTVDVTEAKQKNSGGDTPADLKASWDGIITKINVKSGNCLVHIGDTVKKGDLLVSGVVESASGTVFVHSSGVITAATERTVTVTVPKKRTYGVSTGKKVKKSVIDIFGVKIPLYLGRTEGDCDVHTSLKQASLFGKALPIRLYTAELSLIEKKEEQLTADDAKEELEKKLKSLDEVENLSGFEVKNREYDENEGNFCLKAAIYGEENIAVENIMLFSTGN